MANNESITGKFLLDLEEVMSEICNGYCKYYQVAQELIRISDVVYLIDGYEKDLIARLKKANADRLDKEFWNS